MSSNGAPSNGQYIPYPPPLRGGETVQQRFGGALPVAVSDSPSLAFVLDPRNSTPCNSSFSVRHSKATVATLGEVGDGLGTYLAVGDPNSSNYRGPSYLSLQNTHALSGSSNTMMERVRIGPEGLVTISSNATLNVVGNSVFYGSTVFNGVTFYGGYGNLVNDHSSTSIVYPPTANALSTAYNALSNLIVSSLSFGSSNNSSNGLYAPDLAYLLSSSSNAPYGWWIAQNGNDALVAGPVACSTLFVAPGGCIVASSYCNLVADYRVSDVARPATADALNSAYLQLSNQIYMQIQQAQLYGIVSLDQGGSIPVWGGTATAFQSDLWLRSSDGNDRVLFPSASNSPVVFSAGPATSSNSVAYAWTGLNNASVSNVGGAPNPLMSLTQNGSLSTNVGIRAGKTIDSNTSTVGWGLSYDPSASNLSLSNANLSATGSASFSGSVSVGSNATVGGTITAGGYSNLPYAGTWNSQGSGVPGVVLLMAEGVDPTLEGSNVAATASALKAASEQANSRCDYLQGFLTEAINASASASNVSFLTSNIVFSASLNKAFSGADVATGLTLTNNSTSSNAGVAILLGVGVGPSPQYLSEQIANNPGFVSDMHESNCASISVVTSPLTGIQEMEISGPTTTTYGSNGSVIVEPSCIISVGKQVDVRQGPSGQATLPSDPPGSVYSWTDPSSGAAYSISASSVLFTNAAWCAPYQGVSTSPSGTTGTPWISASGTYDSASGNPTGSCAITANVNGSQTLTGEWLEIDVSPGAFVNQFKVVAPVGLDYIPDAFVLLASTTPVSGPGGAQWRVVSDSIANQGASLVSAGNAGLYYAMTPSWTDTRFVAFRLVVTKIYIATGYLPSGTVQANVQIDVLKLVGSVFAPLPDLLFTVNQSSLVVDRNGNVGFGTSTPQAPIHVAALDGLVAYAGSQGVPGLVLLGNGLQSNASAADFRGWSVSPDGLVQSVETYGAHHAFFAGSNELMRVGNSGIGISTTDPSATLDVAGSLRVRSNVVLTGSSTTACNLTVLGTTTLPGAIVSPALTAASNAAFFGSNAAYQYAAASSNPTYFGSNVAYTTSNTLFGAIAIANQINTVMYGDLNVYGDVSSCNVVAASNAAFFGSNVAYSTSNPAFFGSNVAYAALPIALYGSNLTPAVSYGSNTAKTALDLAIYGSNNLAIASSNPAFYGSNMAYLGSNPAFYGSNMAYASSNAAYYGSNMAYASSNSAYYGSNMAYVSSNSAYYGSNMAYAASNPAFYGSNMAYASSNSAFYGSNMAYASSNSAFYGSNMAYAASNPAFYGSNMAFSSSNAAYYGSNMAYASSNSAFYGSNMAYAASNPAYYGSNTAYASSNAAYYGSNMAYASSNAAYYGSNMAYASSNSAYYGSNLAYASSNSAYYGSNVAYAASNPAFYGSNVAYASSNAAFYGSNLAYAASNPAFYGSNVAFASSNPSYFGSNLAYTMSNRVYYGSNMAYAASNPAFYGSNLAYASSNSAYFGSNMAYASSNSAYYGSNMAYASSNSAYYGSNMAYTSSNAAYYGSNMAYASSNSAYYGSNLAYSSSNSAYYGSNMAYSSSNSAYYGSNMAYASSNTAYYGSNTAYASSNPAYYGSNMAYAASNPTFYGSNTAYACSNPAFYGSNVAFVTSNAVFKNFLFSSSNTAGTIYPYIGIGTTVPTYPLHITVPTTTSATSIWVSGDIVSLSDQRVKSNIVPISDALDKLKSMSGYTYNRTDGDGPDTLRHAGVIAQEVEAVFKEAVHVDKDTGYKSVAYGNLVALLIEAIKETHRSLDARLNRLEESLKK